MKNKVLAAINILGLSVGLACVTLFLLFGVNEFSFNRFHKKAERIHQVVQWSQPLPPSFALGGTTSVPHPLGAAMQAELPDVENFVRVRGTGEKVVRSDNQLGRAKISFADGSFFDIFSFPMKYGSAKTALYDPYGVVLTEKAAQRLFGESNPLGKAIEIKLEDKFEAYIVRGITENIPPNSSLQFEVLGNLDRLSTTEFGKRAVDNWQNLVLQTYVLLRPGSGLAHNERVLQDFFTKHSPDFEHSLRAMGFWKGQGAPVTYRLQPLLEWHLGKDKWKDAAETNPAGIWILLAIAAGILAIACINFTTISIGRSAGRAREVGVRKAIGSSRGQLVRQFLVEAFLLTALSGGLGLLLAQLLLPLFNELTGNALQFSLLLYPEIGGLILGIVVLTTLMAGVYPALVLSGFRPIDALKSKFRFNGANFFTKSLVTSQFVLSIGLIIATFIMSQQVHFMRSQNPGFQKENVLVIRAQESNASAIYPRFRQLALQIPGVMGVAGSEMGIGEGANWSQIGWEYHGEKKDVFQYMVDDYFPEVLQLKLLAGEKFDPQKQGNFVIVNEALVKNFGWTVENAVGKTLDGLFGDNNDKRPLPVVLGVVKDFNYLSLHEAVKPQMLQRFTADYTVPNQIFVRLNPGDPAHVLAALEKAWKKVESQIPLEYSFLDADLDRFYQAETRQSQIIAWASGLAIFLACLGLLGLVAQSVLTRTKEIGIHKILGASVATIIGLLAKDFLKLVLLAILIASPLSYYLMQKWLGAFAYRIEIGWWVFLGVGVLSIGIAFLTIGLQSIKAALANPVKSLRSE